MVRLKKAFNSGFYLEAIFIEYAVIEDRLESMLRHSGKFNPRPNEHWGIERKLTKVEKLAEQKKSLAARYFPLDLTSAVREWKEDRNRLIHALLKQSLQDEELMHCAETGQDLVKRISNKVTSYKRALEREETKRKEKTI